MRRMSGSDLLSEIEHFLAETKISPHRFGIQAARNGRLVERLRAGRTGGKTARVWPETEARIREFMARARRKRGRLPSSIGA